jgi:hypothetical protein
MSNRKVIQENNNYKNKYADNKFNKKIKKTDIRNKRYQKNLFEFENGCFNKNNKIYPEYIIPINQYNDEQINTQNEQINRQNIKNFDILLSDEEEYEEYSPDYFEPQVYKK